MIRIDLADPHYQNLFQYITVFDPSTDGIDNDGGGKNVNVMIELKDDLIDFIDVKLAERNATNERVS